jgi:ABC-type microcin C transport system permease subunit YejB
MTRYIVRRILFFIPVLFVIALITFVTIRPHHTGRAF